MNRAIARMLTCFIVCTLAGFAGSTVAMSDDTSPTPSRAGPGPTWQSESWKSPTPCSIITSIHRRGSR